MISEEDNSKSNHTVHADHVPPITAYDDFKDEEEFETSKIVQVYESKIISKNERSIIINSDNFQNIEDLDARILEILGKDEDGSWKCTICGKKSKLKGHLKEHVEVHFEGLSFSCSDCAYICSTRNKLRQHAYKHRK